MFDDDLNSLFMPQDENGEPRENGSIDQNGFIVDYTSHQIYPQVTRPVFEEGNYGMPFLADLNNGIGGAGVPSPYSDPNLGVDFGPDINYVDVNLQLEDFGDLESTSSRSSKPVGNHNGRSRPTATNASSVTSDSVNGEKGDKKAKRRAAVAAASRATRAKRKRELEDLKDKNKRLEREREEYLSTIAELQMKVQALRETGSIDLRMENDLLRAELSEHKRFLSHFKNVADGLPTTKTAKRVMLIQSSDTAVSQVLGLLSTSMVDPTWRHASLKNGALRNAKLRLRFQRIPGGSKAKTSKRLTFRFDTALLPIDAEKLAEAIWMRVCASGAVVNDPESKFFHRAVQKSIREADVGLGTEFNLLKGFRSTVKKDETVEIKTESITALSTELRDIDISQPKDRGRIKVFSYKETVQDSIYQDQRSIRDSTTPDAATSAVSNYSEVLVENKVALPTPGLKNVLDMLMVVTGRVVQVCHSSFPEPDFSYAAIEFHECLRNKSIECDHSRTGRSDAFILASTFTSANVDEDAVFVGEGETKVSSTPALLEGVVIRPVENGCYLTALYSHPLIAPDGYSIALSSGKSDGIVDDEGFLTPAWTHKVGRHIESICQTFPHCRPSFGL